MKKQIKLNAAVFMLSGRKKILPITLDLFYKNWNNYYEYPLFIYTLNKGEFARRSPFAENRQVSKIHSKIFINLFLKWRLHPALPRTKRGRRQFPFCTR